MTRPPYQELLPGIFAFSAHFDLIESPDDDGWYVQSFPDHRTSSVYSTWEEARDQGVPELKSEEAS